MNNKIKYQQIEKINARYSGLANDNCCLSCGQALNLAEPVEGEVCVDLGSGRGTDVIRMAQTVGVKGYAYGIDTSSGMLAKARNTARKMGIQNAEFLDSTFESLPLRDKCADLVISNCSINHASDKEAVWKQIYRILKGGGRFVVSDIYSTAPVPEQYRNDPEAVAECWAGAVTKEEYLNTLQLAGFSNIRILEESAPYDKGEIQVSSFTISGTRPGCCCG
ncbi:MAG: methyltransferase domain-containing protein [Deltaproteobacteria bacterium]|nr:methyltransferase domain-containing protein [Deltaproteobacteria bacterium]MBN2672461.1 methyltransferase domain-containing protein [Deltaproteobacteria bacterium]